MTAGVSHRITVAGVLSVAIHGSIVLFLLGLIGEQEVVKPPAVQLTEVEVVPPPPSPPPPPTPVDSAPGGPQAPTKPGRGHVARGHSMSHAPPVDDPLAEISVSYDRPGPAEGAGNASGLGALVSANRGNGGGGAGGTGTGTGPKHRPKGPHPKHGYAESTVEGVKRYVGLRIEAELTIDPHGRVVGVRVLSGVEPSLDARVTELAKDFEFDPATDEDGASVDGTARWTFVIVPGTKEYDRFEQPFSVRSGMTHF